MNCLTYLLTYLPLIRLFSYGEITNSNIFMYQSCIGKQFFLWKQPLITVRELEKFKLVAEGTPANVAIKFRERDRLYRTPMIITTNHPIWRFCSK